MTVSSRRPLALAPALLTIMEGQMKDGVWSRAWRWRLCTSVGTSDAVWQWCCLTQSSSPRAKGRFTLWWSTEHKPRASCVCACVHARVCIFSICGARTCPYIPHHLCFVITESIKWAKDTWVLWRCRGHARSAEEDSCCQHLKLIAASLCLIGGWWKSSLAQRMGECVKKAKVKESWKSS